MLTKVKGINSKHIKPKKGVSRSQFLQDFDCYLPKNKALKCTVKADNLSLDRDKIYRVQGSNYTPVGTPTHLVTPKSKNLFHSDASSLLEEIALEKLKSKHEGNTLSCENDEEILNWEHTIEVSQPCETGSIRVKLKYLGESEPMPFDDPWAE